MLQETPDSAVNGSIEPNNAGNQSPEGQTTFAASSIATEGAVQETVSESNSGSGRKSRVETIVDEDNNSVNYTYTTAAVDEKENIKDGLIYTLGTNKVLKPVKVSENQYQHQLESVECLVNKHIIFYITAKRFDKESYRKVKVKQRLAALVESLANDVESETSDFAVLLLSRDRSESDFNEVINNTPFYVIPYEKKATIETLVSLFDVDSALWSQQYSRVIVYDIKKRSVITSWGKLCLALNSNAKCLEYWRKNLSGITVRKWMGLISQGTTTEN